MQGKSQNQRTTQNLVVWFDQFILDRRVRGLSEKTIDFYQQKMQKFIRYAEENGLNDVSDITPVALRGYLSWLEDAGHNKGGINAYYRSLKAFIMWWESEVEPEGWRNPFTKVKPPKNVIEPLDPANMDYIEKMVGTCKNDFSGIRDKAMFYTLVDTGCRAGEFVSINMEDVDLITGTIEIRKGKGGKRRTVFVGKKTRKLLRAWVRVRGNEPGPFWLSRYRERISYSGLREVIRRRSKEAGVPETSLHSFRRLFAKTMHKNGVDLLTLQHLMGHADLSVLGRYVKTNEDDIRDSHIRHGPVDNFGR